MNPPILTAFMIGENSIEARAHAKLNLALAVGPPRPEGMPHAGYHPIASWMHAIALHDDITITRSSSTTYDIAWADGSAVDWSIEHDLCVRAHRALESAVGRPISARVQVRKRIPAGGGLGGGSSDAGVLMLAMRELFSLAISDDRLVHLAHQIGTDLPFFIDPSSWLSRRSPRPALVSGLGDTTERVPRVTGRVTLIIPPFGCPTGAVYRAFDADPTTHCDSPRVLGVLARSAEAGAVQPAELFNDLAAPAESIEPRLRAFRGGLAGTLDAPVLVSGSGSTLFCMEPAERVRDALGTLGLSARVVETELA